MNGDSARLPVYTPVSNKGPKAVIEFVMCLVFLIQDVSSRLLDNTTWFLGPRIQKNEM